MDLSTVRFGSGSHSATTAPTGDRDLCIMEAVSYMAGEPWSDALDLLNRMLEVRA
jgi:hypothetical protein